MNRQRGYLIDPFDKTIRSVMHDCDNYREIYDFLQIGDSPFTNRKSVV